MIAELPWLVTLAGGLLNHSMNQYRVKRRAEQKLHERKLNGSSEQYYVTVAYLLEIASRGSELFKAAEPNEKRELIVAWSEPVTGR